jgi:glycyl-tRNA synthetase alpha subunit
VGVAFIGCNIRNTSPNPLLVLFRHLYKNLKLGVVSNNILYSLIYGLRQIFLAVGIRKYRMDTKYKYHPYKAQAYEEIFGVNEENRSAFCYEMQERANNDHRFLTANCFTLANALLR